MRWNAFELISPSIDKTKKRLFPFAFGEWFKLMIISWIAATSNGFSSGFNSSSNFSQSTKNFGSFGDLVRKYWLVGAILFTGFFILATIWSYFSSVFSFIFIESLVNKKSVFSFGKNHSKGVSLFLFRFFISLASLVIFVLLAFPYLYSFIRGFPIIATVGWPYIIFSIFAVIIFIATIFVIFLFLFDFVVPFMYSKNVPTSFAYHAVWKQIGKNRKETFMYWLARLILGLAAGIIAIVAVIIILAGIIVGAIFFLIFFLLYKLAGLLVLWIILGVIIGLALLLFLIIVIGLVLLPLAVFLRYFALMNFEKLTGIKLLK